jgi:hypothetical protein
VLRPAQVQVPQEQAQQQAQASSRQWVLQQWQMRQAGEIPHSSSSSNSSSSSSSSSTWPLHQGAAAAHTPS